MGRGFWP